MTETLRKIRSLLRLAASTPSVHEARTATAKAKEIIDRHGIDEERVRDNGDAIVRHQVASFKRVPFEVHGIATILEDHFHVQCVSLATGTGRRRRHGVWIFGRPPHVEIASHVFAFLLGAFRRCWGHDRKLYGLPGADRRAYILAMTDGVLANLAGGCARRSEHGTRDATAIVKVDRHLADAVQTGGRRRRGRPVTYSDERTRMAGTAAGWRTRIRRAISASGPHQQNRRSRRTG